MSRLREYTSGNKRTAFAILLILTVIGGLWYTLHPASPKHKRSIFYIKYDHVGLLSSGNSVHINGLPCGKIIKKELFDDYVLVTVSVYASTVIPKNSSFQLINSGLMGEREISIIPTQSQERITAGDTVWGSYEAGLNTIMKDLTHLFTELESLVKIAESSLNDILGENNENLNTLSHKGEKLINVSLSATSEWKKQAVQLIDSCDMIIEKTKKLIDDSIQKSSSIPELIKTFKDQIVQLENTADSLKVEWTHLQENNTLDEFSKLSKQTKKMFENIKILLEDIRKNGVKLNVDIF